MAAKPSLSCKSRYGTWADSQSISPPGAAWSGVGCPGRLEQLQVYTGRAELCPAVLCQTHGALRALRNHMARIPLNFKYSEGEFQNCQDSQGTRECPRYDACLVSCLECWECLHFPMSHIMSSDRFSHHWVVAPALEPLSEVFSPALGHSEIRAASHRYDKGRMDN